MHRAVHARWSLVAVGVLAMGVLLAAAGGSVTVVRLNTLRAEQRAAASEPTERGVLQARTTELGRTWYLIAVPAHARRGTQWLGGPRQAR